MSKNQNTDIRSTISLIKGATSPNIIRKTDIITLLNEIVTDPELIKEGQNLRTVYKTNREAYDKYKDRLNGFILGDFSYRNDNNCLELPELIGFDIDKIKDEKMFDDVFESLTRWSKTFILLPSVSGMGLRIIVKAKFSIDEFDVYYKSICKDINRLTKIKLKSNIREGLRLAEFTNPQIEQYLKTHPHIDDSVGNISRFWYYSGLNKSEVYMNKDSDIYQIKEKKEDRPSGDRQYQYEFTHDDKIGYLIKKLEENRIDITAGWREWFKVGCALYSEFGDHAENLFDRVCQFHQDYDQRETGREWQRVKSKFKQGAIGIGYFYNTCKDFGVVIDYKELKDQLSYKFPSQTRIEITSDQNGTPVSYTATTPEHKTIDHKFRGVEAEKAVIRECLRRSDALYEIIDENEKFGFECFSTKDYKDIYKAIELAHAAQLTIDIVSVDDKLKVVNPKITGAHLRTLLRESEPYDEHLLSNMMVVFENFTKSLIHDLSDQIVGDLSKENLDVFSYIDHVTNEITSMGDYGASRTEKTISQVGVKAVEIQKERVKLYKEGKGEILGCTSGFKDVDELNLGYRAGQLIIRAGRPGMGKTASYLVTALANAKKGKNIGIVTAEMTSTELFDRMVSIESEIPLAKIKRGNLDGRELELYTQTVDYLKSLPIKIDEREGPSINYVERLAKKWKREFDIDFLLIDYLGLIIPGDRYSGDRNNETGDISERLKRLAKRLMIPVIALHQLSRAVETRGGVKRPQLSDLRDSGRLEQDADIVEFLYRPEYYGIKENEQGVSLTGIAEHIIAKGRDSGLGTAYLRFKGECTKFSDHEDLPDGFKGDGWGEDEPVKKQSLKKVVSLDEKLEKERKKQEKFYIVGGDGSSQENVDQMNEDEKKPDVHPNVIKRSQKINDDDIPF